MELKTAIEILDYHQEWRLGKRDDMIHEPKKLTEALDLVLSQVKKDLIAGVGGNEVALIELIRNFIRSRHLTRDWERCLKEWEENQ